MSKRLRFALLIGCSLIGLLVIGIFVRNYEFDSASRALKTGNYSAAVPRLKALASLGDARAQYVLGSMYATGVGVEKNDSEAIRLFRKAAIGSHGEVDPAAAAELAVAKDYAEGTEGAKVDQAESLKWLRRAAEGGSQEAIAELQQSQAPH
jgi:TPR repeat protein